MNLENIKRWVEELERAAKETKDIRKRLEKLTKAPRKRGIKS